VTGEPKEKLNKRRSKKMETPRERAFSKTDRERGTQGSFAQPGIENTKYGT